MMDVRWEEIPHAEREHIHERNLEWEAAKDVEPSQLAIDIAYGKMAEYGIPPENLQKFMTDVRIIANVWED